MTGAEAEREEAQVLPDGAEAELSGSSCPHPPEELSGGPADLTQKARLTLAMQVPPTHLFIQGRTFTGSIRIYHRTLGVNKDVAGALLVHTICGNVRDLESPLTKHPSFFILINSSFRRKRGQGAGVGPLCCESPL